MEIYGLSESLSSDAESASESALYSGSQETLIAANAAPKQQDFQSPQGSDSIFWNKGCLDFNLSSSGLAVAGKTNSAGELRAFIEKLKALAALLPENDSSETGGTG